MSTRKEATRTPFSQEISRRSFLNAATVGAGSLAILSAMGGDTRPVAAEAKPAGYKPFSFTEEPYIIDQAEADADLSTASVEANSNPEMGVTFTGPDKLIIGKEMTLNLDLVNNASGANGAANNLEAVITGVPPEIEMVGGGSADPNITSVYESTDENGQKVFHIVWFRFPPGGTSHIDLIVKARGQAGGELKVTLVMPPSNIDSKPGNNSATYRIRTNGRINLPFLSSKRR
jgi:hypothetical protein